MPEEKLLQAWLSARSLSRGLPPPLPDGGGFRVETGLANEVRRYVFAAAGEPVRRLAQSIHTPRIFLKVCSTAQELMSILPCRWELQSPGFMMLCEGPMSGSAGVLPRGYFLDARADGHAVVARILTDDRQLAASGRAVRHGAIFVYDQIGTDIGHRRRGLARLVMKALETEGRAASDKQVLVATQDGFGLYSALGWTLLSPYATAVILPGQS